MYMYHNFNGLVQVNKSVTDTLKQEVHIMDPSSFFGNMVMRIGRAPDKRDNKDNSKVIFLISQRKHML